MAAIIDAEMQRLKMTRMQLAALSGISPATIVRILKGHHNVTIDTLAQVSGALGSKLQFTLVKEEE